MFSKAFPTAVVVLELVLCCAWAYKSSPQSRLLFRANARTALKSAAGGFEDPNFNYHLPGLLRLGTAAWADDDLATQLRQRFQKIKDMERKCAAAIVVSNKELSDELVDMADEIDETTERFSK